MKYKLLKELPGIEIGTIFTVDDTKVRRKDGYDSTFYVNSYFGEELLNKEWFEEIKEVKSIYDLKEGDGYYYIDGFKNIEYIESFMWSTLSHDLEHGNVFLTKEEAETELQKRKDIAEAQKFLHDNEPDYYLKSLLDLINKAEQDVIKYVKTEKN